MDEKKKQIKQLDNEVGTSKKKKIKDSFIVKDAKTVGNSFLFDMLIPSIKNVFYDISTRVLRMFMFGDSGPANGTQSNIRPYQTISFTPYNQQYKPSNQSQPKPQTTSPSSGFDYDSFVFSSRSDAEFVLNQMQDLIDVYGVVSVSDLYEMCKKTAPYTSDNYGWTNLSKAVVSVCSEGFTIVFPKAGPLH